MPAESERLRREVERAGVRGKFPLAPQSGERAGVRGRRRQHSKTFKRRPMRHRVPLRDALVPKIASHRGGLNHAAPPARLRAQRRKRPINSNAEPKLTDFEASQRTPLRRRATSETGDRRRKRIATRAAFTVLPGNHQIVFSRHLMGGDDTKEKLLAHHGAGLIAPQGRECLPNPEFLAWHRAEVFKEPARE